MDESITCKQLMDYNTYRLLKFVEILKFNVAERYRYISGAYVNLAWPTPIYMCGIFLITDLISMTHCVKWKVYWCLRKHYWYVYISSNTC